MLKNHANSIEGKTIVVSGSGNVINPDEVVDQYGADTMRLYEMFMGDFEQAAPWQTSAIAGCNQRYS